MGWERRGRYKYLYEKRFLHDKIVSLYRGRGASARQAAINSLAERLAKARSRKAFAELKERYRTEEADIGEADEAVRMAAVGLLEEGGCHCHKGMWRKKRGTHAATAT